MLAWRPFFFFNISGEQDRRKMSGQLDEIDDMGELYEMMTFFRIPTKGLKNLDDMKAVLREHLEGSSNRKVGEVSTDYYLTSL